MTNALEEVKYTPGPWKVHKSKADEQGEYYVTAGLQDQISICQTRRCDLASKADAKLIASAPWLLAALESLAQGLQWNIDTHPERHHNCDYEALEFANKIISEAT